MSAGISRHKVVALGNIITGGSMGTTITVVSNYSALPAPGTVPGMFYEVEEPEGVKYIGAIYGGTYRPAGIYYSDGIVWKYEQTASQATQVEVNAGIITDKFVSPLTLNEWYATGPGGQTAFFTWKYSSNTAAADPGNGFFRGNNISAPSVTKLYIADITSGNQLDISNLFAKVKGDWLIHIQQRNDASKWMQFTTSTLYTDNTGWWTLDVVFYAAGSGGSITNLTDCLFTFVNQNAPGTLRVVAKIANYIITRNDDIINCTTNSFTTTLPSALTNEGDVYTIKNSGPGIITLDTTSSQLIDGDLILLLGPGVSIDVQSTGTGYIII